MTLGLFALFGPIGLGELAIIAFILVLIFGANRLSGLGKGMGQAIKGFKDEIKEKPDTPDREHGPVSPE